MRHLRTHKPSIQIEAFNRRLSGGVQADPGQQLNAGQASRLARGTRIHNAPVNAIELIASFARPYCPTATFNYKLSHVSVLEPMCQSD